MHVPSAQTLDIFDHQFEAAKIHRCDRVEGNVQKYEGPLEEGVDGVCCTFKSALGSSIDRDVVTTSISPPGTLCTLCCIKKYTSGTKVPKNAPAKYFLYITALGFDCGLNIKHPTVHGNVAMR